MYNPVSDLLEDLRASRDVEQAVASLLLPIMEALLGSPWSAAGITPRRAALHLRPDQAYRGLWVLGAADAEPHAVDPDDAQALSSSGAWQLIAQSNAPVAIDVSGSAAFSLDGASDSNRELRWASSGLTQHRLARERTGLYVALPLRAPRVGVGGMITLELSSDRPEAALSQLGAWTSPLQLLADVATPYLVALPQVAGRSEAEGSLTSPLLPVVGKAMAPVVRLLGAFASHGEPLLIQGPTGAGKTRLAAWCRSRSSRASGPFVTVDMLGLPEDMQLPRLFGWKKGAFTGADADSKGDLGRAEGGVLFLDEIDKLSLKAQAGLLRVLDEGRYRPLGHTGDDKIADVQIIFGTNKDLVEEVEAGRFREDLYYRISVVPVQVPPLDARRDEIPLWARAFLRRQAEEQGGEGDVALTAPAASLLQAAPWPGNLRQLSNVLRRAWVLASMEGGPGRGAPTVDVHHIQAALGMARGPQEASGADALRAAARCLFLKAQAASASGISFDLDLVQGLKGLVLMEAYAELGDLAETFRLFGLGAMVDSRNHNRIYRREVERAEALLEAVGDGSGAR